MPYDEKANQPMPKGHYEKLVTNETKYIYVDSNLPSGLSDAFVVSRAEAEGRLN